MKKILFLLILATFSSCAINTSFNTFYQDHEDDSEFSFGLSSSLIANFLPDDDVEDIKPLLKKAKHIRILVFSEHAEDKTEKFEVVGIYETGMAQYDDVYIYIPFQKAVSFLFQFLQHLYRTYALKYNLDDACK